MLMVILLDNLYKLLVKNRADMDNICIRSVRLALHLYTQTEVAPHNRETYVVN